MRLARLYIRFYKSFNYDYERKSSSSAEDNDWERVEDAWFPYVRIALEPSITTIVGANESGKTHLLNAIESLIHGTGVGPTDFCRYSHLFSVQQGQRRTPDFAGDFEVCTEHDRELSNQHLGLSVAVGQCIRVLRENGAPPQSSYKTTTGHRSSPWKRSSFNKCSPRLPN